MKKILILPFFIACLAICFGLPKHAEAGTLPGGSDVFVHDSNGNGINNIKVTYDALGTSTTTDCPTRAFWKYSQLTATDPFGCTYSYAGGGSSVGSQTVHTEQGGYSSYTTSADNFCTVLFPGFTNHDGWSGTFYYTDTSGHPVKTTQVAMNCACSPQKITLDLSAYPGYKILDVHNAWNTESGIDPTPTNVTDNSFQFTINNDGTLVYDVTVGTSYPLNVTKAGTGTGTVTAKSGKVLWWPENMLHVGLIESSSVAMGSDLLKPGEILRAGESRSSANGQYRLVYQSDGNLVVYKEGETEASWAMSWPTEADHRNTANSATWAGGYVVMQADGNLVAYNVLGPYWSSGTFGNPGAWLAVQNDGWIAIRSAGPEINCGSNCSQSIRQDFSALLWATPDAGSTFEGWTGCGWSNGSVCAVSMDNTRNVTATFSGSPPPPPVVSCTISPTQISKKQGESTNVTWSDDPAKAPFLLRAPGISDIPLTTSQISLMPAQTTTYTLYDKDGATTCQTKITITPHQSGTENPAPPN